MYNEVHKKNLSLNLSNFKLYFIKEKKMTNYIFLLELYFILTVLTFLYPKALQKRNHIINGILMGFFLILVEFIFIPAGIDLSINGLIDTAIRNLPASEAMIDPSINQIPILKDRFIQSLVIPAVFFIIGRVIYAMGKIKLSTFDTLYTGLFPFVLYLDFIIFIGLKGMGGLIWHYILFFVIYAMFSFGRIELFMFFGIKNLLDNRSFKREEA